MKRVGALAAILAIPMACGSAIRFSIDTRPEDWEPHRGSASREVGGDLEGLAEAAREHAGQYCSERGKRAVVWDGQSFFGGGGRLLDIGVHGAVSRTRASHPVHTFQLRCESPDGIERPPAGAPPCPDAPSSAVEWLAARPARPGWRDAFTAPWLAGSLADGSGFELHLETPPRPGRYPIGPVTGTRVDIRRDDPPRWYRALSGTVVLEEAGDRVRGRVEGAVLLGRAPSGAGPACVARLEELPFAADLPEWATWPACTPRDVGVPGWSWKIEAPFERASWIDGANGPTLEVRWEQARYRLALKVPPREGRYPVGRLGPVAFEVQGDGQAFSAASGLLVLDDAGEYGSVRGTLRELVVVPAGGTSCIREARRLYFSARIH